MISCVGSLVWQDSRFVIGRSRVQIPVNATGWHPELPAEVNQRVACSAVAGENTGLCCHGASRGARPPTTFAAVAGFGVSAERTDTGINTGSIPVSGFSGCSSILVEHLPVERCCGEPLRVPSPLHSRSNTGIKQSIPGSNPGNPTILMKNLIDLQDSKISGGFSGNRDVSLSPRESVVSLPYPKMVGCMQKPVFPGNMVVD